MPPPSKSPFTAKDPDTGKERARGEGADRGGDGWMAPLTQWSEFEQAPGDGDGQGGLVCCSPRGHKESVTT